MNIKFFPAVLCFVLFFGQACFSQGLRVRGKEIVNSQDQPVILRGFGLGGWMLQEPYMLQLSGVAAAQHDIRKKIVDLVGAERTKSFYDTWLSSHCTKADIDSLAAWGFNSVRLPMHYNLYTLPVEEEPVQGTNTWLQQGFELTDSLLKWCGENGIYLILDLHAAPGGQGNDVPIADRDTTRPYLWTSEAARQKTIALWEKLAERYKHEKWIGAYDLINEPNYGFEDGKDKNGCSEKGNAALRQLYIDITKAIRKIDREHIIIIEGNCWGNNYAGMFPLWDQNMVLSFHKYWNYTDQGSIQPYLDLREQYQVPIWCGETGENSNVWFREAINLFERNNIGWAMWPLKKSGGNNPLEVKMNEGYRKIIAYWSKKGPRPSADEAYSALLQYAGDTRIDRNVFHKDVVDAMIRQVNSDQTVAFKKHVLNNDLKIFAVDYDLGRNGYAYWDKDTGNYWVSNNQRTAWNHGRQYRNDGVDIEISDDVESNGFHVGFIEEGEWLQYSFYAAGEASYELAARLKGPGSGDVQFTINETGRSSIALKEGRSGWTWTGPVTIRSKKGWNTVRVSIGGKDNQFSALRLTRKKG